MKEKLTPQECAERLQKAGVRPTQQRLSVYRYLVAHPVHPTVEIIYQALVKDFPSFSLTTVYNALRVLEKAGLIRAVTIDPAVQRFDGNPQDHGHFHCRRCQEVSDFPISKEQLETLVPPGSRPEQLDVYIAGLCPRCAEEETAVLPKV